jgi:hypothetical protein
MIVTNTGKIINGLYMLGTSAMPVYLLVETCFVEEAEPLGKRQTCHPNQI